jgi:hypothetical protein
MTTRAEALSAQTDAVQWVRAHLKVAPVAIGLKRFGAGWGYRISLPRAPRATEMPAAVMGIPAEFHVTGAAVAFGEPAGGPDRAGRT